MEIVCGGYDDLDWSSGWVVVFAREEEEQGMNGWTLVCLDWREGEG